MMTPSHYSPRGWAPNFAIQALFTLDAELYLMLRSVNSPIHNMFPFLHSACSAVLENGGCENILLVKLVAMRRFWLLWWRWTRSLCPWPHAELSVCLWWLHTSCNGPPHPLQGRKVSENTTSTKSFTQGEIQPQESPLDSWTKTRWPSQMLKRMVCLIVNLVTSTLAAYLTHTQP